MCLYSVDFYRTSHYCYCNTRAGINSAISSRLHIQAYYTAGDNARTETALLYMQSWMVFKDRQRFASHARIRSTNVLQFVYTAKSQILLALHAIKFNFTTPPSRRNPPYDTPPPPPPVPALIKWPDSKFTANCEFWIKYCPIRIRIYSEIMRINPFRLLIIVSVCFN